MCPMSGGICSLQFIQFIAYLIASLLQLIPKHDLLKRNTFLRGFRNNVKYNWSLWIVMLR